MSTSQDFIDKFNSPEYGVWFSMIKRCHDPNNKAYKDYGGRGIVVCDRWLGFDGFDNFIMDMGHRPSNDLSLDRINNDGSYSLENCRWATRKEQARNRRSNKLFTVNGITKTIAEWAEWTEQTGVDQKVISARVRFGWTAELAIFSPLREKANVAIGSKYGKWTVISNI